MDLVKRLRAELEGADHLSDLDLLCADAADEIERLRAALELIATTGPARHYEIAEKALGKFARPATGGEPAITTPPGDQPVPEDNT